MTERVRGNYAHTIYASSIGYLTQAIVNNFAPLLFLTFASEFGLRLEQITILTTLNFLVQLGADFLMAQLGDRLGTRPCVVAAHFFAAAGLLGLAVLPSVLGYAGLLISVFFYACGGGIIEVLLSPIVENCPTERKEAVMSLLHSFYCWGHVLLVVASTLFFTVFGIGNWRILACIWALVPLFNAFYFMAVPIYPGGSHEPLSMGQLFKQKIFWFFVVVMVCAGASEQAMSQWASSFAESALGCQRPWETCGPLRLRPAHGTSRALYGKFSEWLPLKGAMAGSAALCILCYVLAAFFGSPVLGLLGCASAAFPWAFSGRGPSAWRPEGFREAERHVRLPFSGRRSGLLRWPDPGGDRGGSGGRKAPGRPGRGHCFPGGDPFRPSAHGPEKKGRCGP